MSAIEPLRINKGTPASSPTKSNPALSPRPLSEVNPSERRRNSPSFNQTTRISFLDSSPLESSPFNSKFNLSPFNGGSPLSYWQSRDPASPTKQSHENSDPKESTPGLSKRPSVENLKKASRVKNSSIFAKEQEFEYDPASTAPLHRPLAAGRPFNSALPVGLWGKRSDALKSPASTKDSSVMYIQETKETKSPQHHQASPTKSSLSRNSRWGNGFEDTSQMSEEEDIVGRQIPSGKVLRRHAKSVTFDTGPPEINEFEMTTPDPSSIASGSREGSFESNEDEDEEGSFIYRPNEDNDDSFDASLEDTEKTPVVLPEDWRFMSPENANETLASKFEDPFDMRKSPALGSEPVMSSPRPSPTRTDSLASNGERRPLPAIPSPPLPDPRASSPGTLHSKAQEVATAKKAQPVNMHAASVSKSEVHGLSAASMSLEDRLRLMSLQQNEHKPTSPRLAADEQRERRMRRAQASPDRSPAIKSGFRIHEDHDIDNEPQQPEIQLPSLISRESIMRKVKAQASAEEFRGSPTPSEGGEMLSYIETDPDVAIPSLEDDHLVADDGTLIKQEEEESGIDLDLIPEMYSSDQHFQAALQHAQSPKEDDEDSHYSFNSQENRKASPLAAEKDGAQTPKASAIDISRSLEEQHKPSLSLPQFPMLSDNDFSSSFSQYTADMEKSSHGAVQVTKEVSCIPNDTKITSLVGVHPIQPSSSDEETCPESDRESTPDSVIRHKVYSSEDEEDEFEPAPVPESKATIKAPGGFKTRVSLAPADVSTMAETRRKVSGDLASIPPVPAKHRNRPSVIPEADSFMLNETQEVSHDSPTKTAKRKSSLLPLEVPMDVDASFSMGMDKEFDRVTEVSKKGYLTRQNTKLIVASSASAEGTVENGVDGATASRGSRSAGNSPVKNSATWTTEPWNGRVRRKSIRQSGGGPMMNLGVAPPLPGMPSNVSYNVDEAHENLIEEADEFEEGQERGRLFVKVVGVKDLDVPLPRGERSYFCLTLDNGLHCVTTSWLELGRNAPIGQEFELVVLNDLEFQLTLSTKLEEPRPTNHTSASLTRLQKPKASAFSRVFGSPKKRKEQELKQQEADIAERQRVLEAGRPKTPTAWDLLHNLVGKDGSFARSYVSLKDHETQAYGRPYTVDVPCFNEWAQEEVRHMSAKGGRSIIGGMQRKAPYKVAKLELQLLYVPKPKEATDDDMPKSMNACVREIQDAERAAAQVYEGHLSQQGGDCPYWRRRFFRLEGSKLTAYHEATRQPRATINLAKATRLIDDKSSLTQKEVSGKGGSRRRSAFAQEEEGYMFVEEGFRMRFANGEVIDFYADKTADKEGWMKVLAEVVGTESPKNNKSWTAIVLKRERALASSAAKSGASATPSPVKASFSRPFSQQPAPPRPSSSSLDKPLPSGPLRDQRKIMTPAERREKSKTMLF